MLPRRNSNLEFGRRLGDRAQHQAQPRRGFVRQSMEVVSRRKLGHSHRDTLLCQVPGSPSHIQLHDPDMRRPGVGHRRNKTSGEIEYIYQPLQGFNEFRLLSLEPGDSHNPLYASIMVYSTTDRPVYQAISYAWGPGLKPYKVSTPQGTLRITASLDLALRAIEAETRRCSSG